MDFLKNDLKIQVSDDIALYLYKWNTIIETDTPAEHQAAIGALYNGYNPYKELYGSYGHTVVGKIDTLHTELKYCEQGRPPRCYPRDLKDLLGRVEELFKVGGWFDKATTEYFQRISKPNK